MMMVVTWFGRLLAALGLLGGGVFLLGPREPVDLDVRFDSARLAGGVDAYLAAEEARFADITPGTEKRVIWAGAPETRTPLAIVYAHGFSATSEEIRPVPDRVAEALGANLFFTRFSGHGQPGAALAGHGVRDWMTDMAEALAVGRAIGDRVVVIAVSTGATWATLATQDAGMMQDVAGIAMISPNFRIKAPAARILTWPAVRWWGPVVAGAERSYPAMSEAHGRYWTTSYPTVAVVPMAAGVARAAALDHSRIDVPAMFVFDPRDQVVDQAVTARVAADWGGPKVIREVAVGDGDDPNFHVIAGDILSPNQNAALSGLLIDWIGGL